MTDSLDLALRKRTRLPLSLKIKYILRSRLECGEWPIGTQIPTLPDLVSQYRVSRATVRAALDELAREGLIERTRGKGTFVISDAAKEHWLMLPTDWRSLVRHIEQLDVRFTILEAGNSILPAEFSDEHDAQSYWCTTRINWTNNIPYSLNTVYVASRLACQKQDEFESEPVLPVITRHFRDEIRSATQTLTIRAADAQMAKHMKIDIGMPVAQAIRLAKNLELETIYAARILYPAKYLYIETHFRPFDEND